MHSSCYVRSWYPRASTLVNIRGGICANYIYTYSYIYIHIYIYISPDEWATTKQACRDELVVYLFVCFFFSPIYNSLYFHVLSTVLRISSFAHFAFRNERYRNATELSKHVWNLKDQNIQYNIKWRKIKQARSYSNVTKKCNLCLWEKYFILCKPEMSSLNNRNELVSCCRHSRKFLLRNVIT